MTPAIREEDNLSPSELRDIWPILLHDDRVAGFSMMARPDAEDFFLELHGIDQAELLLGLALEPASGRGCACSRPTTPPTCVQEAPLPERDRLLALLDEPTRKEVNALLAYAEDDAGGLMNPRYARAPRPT